MSIFGAYCRKLSQFVARLFIICGHPGVEGHPQGKVKDGFPVPHFIADFKDIHTIPPPLSSTQDTGKVGEYPARNLPNPTHSNRWFSTKALGCRPHLAGRSSALAVRFPICITSIYEYAFEYRKCRADKLRPAFDEKTI